MAGTASAALKGIVPEASKEAWARVLKGKKGGEVLTIYEIKNEKEGLNPNRVPTWNLQRGDEKRGNDALTKLGKDTDTTQETAGRV